MKVFELICLFNGNKPAMALDGFKLANFIYGKNISHMMRA